MDPKSDRFLDALADVYKEMDPLDFLLDLTELVKATKHVVTDNGDGTYTHTFTPKSARELANQIRNN